MPRIRLDPFDDDNFDDLDELVDPDPAADPRQRRARRHRWDRTPDDPDLAPDERRSTYQESRSAQGPQPPPAWLITSSVAIDRDLGVLKTGKEADVYLVERLDPSTGAACLLAAKRYRSADHRLFHRDAGYLEGRRVRRSRENRAMVRRTDFGRDLLTLQWSSAEFGALEQLWTVGAAVPYPVQCNDTELLLEFVGADDGTVAPRLADARVDRQQLTDLFGQCCAAMRTMASRGWAHGDLSPYNLLVDDDRLVVIDLPQVVDVVSNSHGRDFLGRDCTNICRWFQSKGLDVNAGELTEELAAIAGV